MPASSQRQAGEVSWLDSGACPSCLLMWCAMGARESVDGLHESRKLQLVHDSDSTSEISDSMAVSAVTSAVVLYLALAATQTQLPIAAFSFKPRKASPKAVRQQHVSMLIPMSHAYARTWNAAFSTLQSDLTRALGYLRCLTTQQICFSCRGEDSSRHILRCCLAFGVPEAGPESRC